MRRTASQRIAWNLFRMEPSSYQVSLQQQDQAIFQVQTCPARGKRFHSGASSTSSFQRWSTCISAAVPNTGKGIIRTYACWDCISIEYRAWFRRHSWKASDNPKRQSRQRQCPPQSQAFGRMNPPECLFDNCSLHYVRQLDKASLSWTY
jgi:hypothetical protein